MKDPSAATERERMDVFGLCGATIENKYRVASVVGDGGFGIVYRGVHKGFGELIAIKCLKVSTELDGEAREALLETLREEGRILHLLSKATSGIVQALDVGAFTTDAGVWVPFLILEWLDGQTLGDYLRARRRDGKAGMPLAEAMDLLEPAARALGVAHAHHVAHRDIKPANLFLTNNITGSPTLKVLDFGIAKVLSEHASRTTQLEVTNVTPSAFTPRYGAPEQFSKARGATGPWTDVFALALILVELVSGKQALEGDDATQLYIASADPGLRPTLRARGMSCGAGVDAVLDKALAVEPKDRYANASELWNALIAATAEPSDSAIATRVDQAQGDPTRRDVQALAMTAPVESLQRRAGPIGTPDDPMSETPIPGDKARGGSTRSSATAPERRGSAWPWIAAAALVLGGGSLGYVLWGGAPPAKKPANGSPTSAIDPALSVPPAPVASGSAGPGASASAEIVEQPPPFVAPSDMALIAPATFLMGGTTSTTITRGFYLDMHEVTVRDYADCVSQSQCSAANHVAVTAEGGAAGAGDGYAADWTPRCNVVRGASSDPINCVDFTNAESYCRFRGRRLPTEAEWELAARGAEGRAFPWGSAAPSCGDSCFARQTACLLRDAPVSTCAVGVHPRDKTADLIYDLGGNVSEWVADGFGPLLGGSDPVGSPDSPLRMARGGSFRSESGDLQTNHRAALAPVTADVNIGFRCALDAPAIPPTSLEESPAP